MLLAVHGGYFFLFSPVILLHFLFGKEVSCITGDVHVEAGVGQDDFESSFWPWDSEDRTKVKGLWVRHQQGHSSKQRVSRRDSDVTKNLLNICHVTGCYLHAFPNREGIKHKEGHVNFTQGPRWWGWRLRWAGELCKHESSGLTKLKQANNLHLVTPSMYSLWCHNYISWRSRRFSLSSHPRALLLPSIYLCFFSYHSLETALSKVTSELQERSFGGAFFSGSSSLLWFSPPDSTHLSHPVLPWPLRGCFFCWTTSLISGFRFYHNFLKDVCPNSQSYF